MLFFLKGLIVRKKLKLSKTLKFKGFLMPS